MKAYIVIAALLASFFGFIGCSSSNQGYYDAANPRAYRPTQTDVYFYDANSPSRQRLKNPKYPQEHKQAYYLR